MDWLKLHGSAVLEWAFRLALVGISVYLFFAGSQMAHEANAGSATATYAAAGLAAAFAFLIRFKRFKALGFEGELWEDKMQEAAELTNRLKGLSVVIAAPLVTMSARLGRFNSGTTRRELSAVVQQVEKLLSDAGVPSEEIKPALSEYHKVTLRDLVRDVAGEYQRVAERRAASLRADPTGGAAKTPEQQRIESDTGLAITEIQNKISEACNRSMATGDLSNLGEEVRRIIRADPRLTQEWQTELLSAVRHPLDDLAEFVRDGRLSNPEPFFDRCPLSRRS